MLLRGLRVVLHASSTSILTSLEPVSWLFLLFFVCFCFGSCCFLLLSDSRAPRRFNFFHSHLIGMLLDDRQGFTACSARRKKNWKSSFLSVDFLSSVSRSLFLSSSEAAYFSAALLKQPAFLSGSSATTGVNIILLVLGVGGQGLTSSCCCQGLVSC